MTYVISPKGYRQYSTPVVKEARQYLIALDAHQINSKGWGTFGPQNLPFRIEGDLQALAWRGTRQAPVPVPIKQPKATKGKSPKKGPGTAHARLMAGETIPAWRPHGTHD